MNRRPGPLKLDMSEVEFAFETEDAGAACQEVAAHVVEAFGLG